MANKKYTQYILLAAIAVFIVVGLANYGGTPSGYAGRYDVTEWTCDWDNGWHWTGETSTNTWQLERFISQTEAYCKTGTWTCIDIEGDSILTTSTTAECGSYTQFAVCRCRR